METSRVLKSRRGWPQYLGMAALLAAVGFELWSGVIGLTSGASVWRVLASSYLAAVFVWFFGSKLAREYEVSPAALVASSWGKKQVIAWERITEIDVLLAFFSRVMLRVTYDGGGLVIASGQSANHKRLNRAIIKHAYRHNPNVKISKNVREIYDYPVHDDFTGKGADLQLP